MFIFLSEIPPHIATSDLVRRPKGRSCARYSRNLTISERAIGASAFGNVATSPPHRWREPGKCSWPNRDRLLIPACSFLSLIYLASLPNLEREPSTPSFRQGLLGSRFKYVDFEGAQCHLLQPQFTISDLQISLPVSAIGVWLKLGLLC